MLRLIRWIAGFIIVIGFAAFAALNRQSTVFYFTPLHDPIEWPLFALILAAAGTGFLLGAFTVWLNESKIRQERRAQRKQIKSLEKELEQAETAQKKPVSQPDSALFPAISNRS
ncbi:MAG: lipopolysaccharide assembly LapA domain-containing protein [Alphaproteobacteria bacterium]